MEVGTKIEMKKPITCVITGLEIRVNMIFL